MYQFLYNGKQYTYGGYVAKDNSINSRAYFSVYSSDSYSVDIWAVSLRFKGFLLSSEYNEDAWGDRYYKYDEHIDCNFRLKYFNPETASEGDVIDFDQNVRSDFGYDMFNYLSYVTNELNGEKHSNLYSWTGDALGSIKFVSYRSVAGGNVLVLDFQNVRIQKVTQGDGAEQATINGEIIFIDNFAGVVSASGW